MKAQADVQAEKSSHHSPLEWVGMSQIQTMMAIQNAQGQIVNLPALLDVGVDLLENHRGIHMSRLYRLHQDLILNQPLNEKQVFEFARQSLESHSDISRSFAGKIKLNWPRQTVSLASNLAGFRMYPVEVIFEQCAGKNDLWLQFEVLYSSTCPQSAGLSMQVVQSKTAGFDRLPATPHAQRSRAVVQVMLSELNPILIENLITQVENALGTPVQTTVKKADELRFAELNAENLMFCEDAARKISKSLAENKQVHGFSVYCEHQESLHPHNASSLNARQFRRPQRLNFG